METRIVSRRREEKRREEGKKKVAVWKHLTLLLSVGLRCVAALAGLEWRRRKIFFFMEGGGGEEWLSLFFVCACVIFFFAGEILFEFFSLSPAVFREDAVLFVKVFFFLVRIPSQKTTSFFLATMMLWDAELGTKQRQQMADFSV